MRGTLRDQFRGQHPFFWVVVIAAVFAVCICGWVWAMVYKYAGMAKEGFQVDGQMRIVRVYPGGPAEGKLQVGDTIVTVNGHSTYYSAFIQEFFNLAPGTAYTLEIERNAIKQSVAMRLDLHYSPDRSLITEVSAIVVAPGFLLMAILLGLLRPAEPIIRHFFVAFYTLGFFFLWQGYTPSFYNHTEQMVLMLLVVVSGPLISVPILFHLFLRFPPGIAESKLGNLVKWLFYFVSILTQIALFVSIKTEWQLQVKFPLFIPLFLAGIFLAIVVVVIRNYRLVTETRQRQQFKWIILSSGIGFGSLFLAFVIEWVVFPQLEGATASDRAMIDTLGFVITTLALLSIPIAWAYAILKHRVLDIRVVIRRSLRYLLVSRGFILIEALLAFAVLSFLFAGRLGAWLDRFGSNTRTLITILGTVLMVLGLQTVNRKIRPLIDRRFFRDAYDAQQILTELGSSLRATTNVNQVLELTTAKIQQALYAANVTIFLRNGQHDFHSAVSRDYLEREKSSQSVARDLHLPDEAYVVQRINDSAQPAEIDWDDPYSPVATQLAAMANGDAAAQQEFDTLRELKTNLILPLAAKDELLGVLALGPRAGDLPYSREDKRMLMNVAGQTAMALENSRLIEQKIEIEAEHNRKTQELEEARRLQLSMLPKGNVKLERVEITGAMRTATEVGGDYYDFLPLPDGRYCVVIGDATGHGMSAGLIVGMVKMGLTSRLQTAPKLQPMIEDLNAALKQSLTHRGVGMCLGATMIDPVTLQVELCSNGMPFPYHFTNGKLRAIELKAQPLGFLKRVNVPTAMLPLQSGDALIWVSDGFEERMNARNEEWGAEQVAAALQAICQRETSGAAIAQALIAACDRASDGRNNDDDMTIVVLKAL